MIREFQKEDFFQVVSLAKEFWDELNIAPILGDFNENHFQIVFFHHWNLGTLKCWVYTKENSSKILGGTMFLETHNFFTGLLGLEEIAWFVKKEHRGGLVGVKILDFVSKYAKTSTAKYKYINIYHMDTAQNDALKRFYLNFGFKPGQWQYFKAL
jgi:GNAT superfamily N-acetyltransferase